MKGIVLILLSVVLMPVLAVAQTAQGDFSVSPNSMADPAAMLIRKAPAQHNISPGQLLVADQQETDTRESRPSVAYTIFSFDTRVAQVSVQPILGKINGAQLQLNW